MFILDWFNEGSLALQIFRVVAGVGLIMAILQVILRLLGADSDGDIDTDSDTDGHVISWTTLAGFALGFGTTGAIMTGSGYSVPAAASAGVATGLVIGACFYFLMRGFNRLKEDNTFRIENTVGKTATVYVRIPARQSGGQVQVVAQSRMMTLAAHCETEVPTGGKVRVIEVIDHETVKVTPV